MLIVRGGSGEFDLVTGSGLATAVFTQRANETKRKERTKTVCLQRFYNAPTHGCSRLAIAELFDLAKVITVRQSPPYPEHHTAPHRGHATPLIEAITKALLVERTRLSLARSWQLECYSARCVSVVFVWCIPFIKDRTHIHTRALIGLLQGAFITHQSLVESSQRFINRSRLPFSLCAQLISFFRYTTKV